MARRPRFQAIEWLPARLAASLRDFYVNDPDGAYPLAVDQGDEVWRALVHRGRFDRKEDLGERRIECRTGKSGRAAAVRWRVAAIESDPLVDGPAPPHAVGFDIRVYHDDAEHCAEVTDALTGDLFPHMVSLDSIYDDDDDPTVQELRLHACTALFGMKPDDLPDIPGFYEDGRPVERSDSDSPVVLAS